MALLGQLREYLVTDRMSGAAGENYACLILESLELVV
jgi:hypothetical protein